jgi:hypothetical protein
MNNSDIHSFGSMRITMVKEAEGELVWVKSRKLLEELKNFSLVWLKGKPTANHSLTTLPHMIKSGVEADVFPLEQRIRGVSQRRFRGKYVLQWFGGTISLFILA